MSDVRRVFGLVARWLPILLFCAWLGQPASAGQPFAREKPGRPLDLHGNPLPEGAVNRLGSIHSKPADAIEALAFAPDGQTLVSVHQDRSFRVWDPATGKQRGRFQGPAGVAWLCFGPDNKTLLASSLTSVGLWDVTTGRPLHQCPLGKRKLLHTVFAPTGRALFWTAAPSGAISQWDLLTDKEERTFAGHEGEVLAVALSPDGQTLASSAADRTVRLWETASGKAVHKLDMPKPARLLLFAPNGWSLYAEAEDRARVWEVDTGDVLNTLNSITPRRAHVFSADSRFLFWAELDSAAVSYFTATFGAFGKSFEGHFDRITSLVPSPDRRLLASGSADGTVLLWDLTAAPWQREPVPGRVPRKTLEVLWRQLAQPGGQAAYDARWSLVNHAQQTVDFLRDQMHPVRPVLAEEVAQLIDNLDRPERPVREKAFARLSELGAAVEAPLRLTVAKTTSAEVRLRAELLLEQLEQPRQLRALQVLEQLDLREAHDLLRDLASGQPDAWMTRQAQAALRRLDARPRQQQPGSPRQVVQAQVKVVPKPNSLPAVPSQPGRDRFGDRLPPSARARVGTLRLRHQDEVYSVAFTPDGQKIVSGGDDGTVRLWEAASGKELRCWRLEGEHFRSVAVTPDGRQIIAGTLSGQILLWDARTGQQLDLLNTHIAATLLTLSPDGQTLAVYRGHSIVLWEMGTWRERARLEAPMNNVTALVFSPDGEHLALSGRGAVCVCSVRTAKTVWTGERRADGVAFTPDGRSLITLEAHSLLIREASTGRVLREVSWELNWAGGLALAPDGKTVVCAGGSNDRLCLIDLASGSAQCLSPGSGAGPLRALAFAPDGRRLATAGSDHRVRLWDTHTGREQPDLGGSVAGPLCLSPDGRTLATVAGTIVQLAETATGTPLRQLRLQRGHFTHAAWSPSGHLLAVSAEVQTSHHLVLFFDPATGRLLRQAEQPGRVSFLAFAAKGQSLATGDEHDFSIHLWDPATAKEMSRLIGHDDSVLSGSFSPDGRTLVTGSTDGTLRVWDLSVGAASRAAPGLGGTDWQSVLPRLAGPTQSHFWKGHAGSAISSVVFSPDGTLLISAGGGFIRTWRSGTWKPVRQIACAEERSPFVAISGDGQLLASAGANHQVVLWETQTGRLRAERAGHQELVRAAVFTPDGRSLISSSADGTALVWDLTQELPASPRAQPEPVATDRHGEALPAGVRLRLGWLGFPHERGRTRAAFAPDGQTIALASPDPRGPVVVLRDAATGRERRRLGPLPSAIEVIAYAPTGRLLAVGGDRFVSLWDPQTGDKLHQVVGHPDGVACVAFSDDGKVLATAGGQRSAAADYAIRLWDVPSGQELRQLLGHRSPVAQLVFSRDGKHLFSCSHDLAKQQRGQATIARGSICVWDLQTDKLERQYPSKGEADTLAPDGRTLVYKQSEARKLAIWDLTADKLLCQLEGQGESWTYSPDGGTLATNREDRMIQMWEVATGKELRRFQGHPGRGSLVICFSPDGKRLVCRSDAPVDKLRIWDVSTGQEVRDGGPVDEVSCLVFAPDGQSLAGASADQTVRVWQLASGREVFCLKGHTRTINLVVYSPDGRLLASGDETGTIYLWDAVTGKERGQFSAGGAQGRNGLTSLVFLADGKQLGAGGTDGSFHIWDVATGKEAGPDKAYLGSANPLLLSPDGRTVVLWGREGDGRPRNRLSFLVAEDLATGRPLYQIVAPEREKYWYACFSPDGRLLALSCTRALTGALNGLHDHQVRLLETATGKEIQRLELDDYPLEMVFSPDGRFLAGSGMRTPQGLEGGIRVWDLKERREVACLRGHHGFARSIAFGPDNRTLASGAWDSTVLLWPLSPGPGQRRQPTTPAPDAGQLWEDLASPDAARAYRAVWYLADKPEQALTLLQRLQPRTALRPGLIRALIRDLDSDQFSVREQTRHELAPLVDLAGEALRQELRQKPSAELRRQLEALLNSEVNLVPYPERLREVRATAVLEVIGTAEARQLLRRLATGADEARLTREAKAALQRLARRLR